MNRDRLCSDCGANITFGNGLCPTCLFRTFDDEPVTDETTEAQIKFGSYDLLEEIGHGGMGRVWKARSFDTKRVVALKMLHAGRFAGVEEVSRFKREAEAVCALDHSNIVPVYEVGEQEGQRFFTMKLIEGKTLRKKLSESNPKNPTTIRNAAELVSKLARAVHHAHQRGIIHRDLKPSNIIIDSEGEPNLTDFGLAHSLESSVNLTRSGDFLGSVGYMAPEQTSCGRKGVTTAVDVYSLGCIFYEMLTGSTPHRSESAAQGIYDSVHSEVQSPRRHNVSIDRDLETICLKCLQKDPQNRYSSAVAVADDLDLWLGGRPITARPISGLERFGKWVRRSPLKVALVFAITLAIVGPLAVVAWFFIRELPYRATVHHIVDRDIKDVYHLDIWDGQGDRCTPNFARQHSTGPEGSILRLTFTNVPPEWLPKLQVQIRADQAGRPDPVRSPVLTNGQVFNLRVESFFDRAFYCSEVGFAASNLLAVAPQAKILLVPAGSFDPAE